MDTNGHELFNHEKHEGHENIGKIQNHEWTRMAKDEFNHEKHEKHKNKKGGEEEPRMDTNIIYSWDCSLVLPWVAFCAFVAFAPPTAYILLLSEE